MKFIDGTATIAEIFLFGRFTKAYLALQPLGRGSLTKVISYGEGATSQFWFKR